MSKSLYFAPCPQCKLNNFYPARFCRQCKASIVWDEKAVEEAVKEAMNQPRTISNEELRQDRQASPQKINPEKEQLGFLLTGFCLGIIGLLLTYYGFIGAAGGGGNWLWKSGFLLFGIGAVFVWAGFSSARS